jgi:alpha-amylase/alpha-mannosidase (GH57 family)
MSADTPASMRRARVAICWHMHQPDYRTGGAPLLPWTYLHALRAYTDMAAHLEAVPDARVVVNFSPVLLDQLLDLAQQAQAALDAQQPPTEPLMAALLTPPRGAARATLLRACLRVHPRNAHERYDEYARRALEAESALARGDDAVAALPEQSVLDLLVWYHLVWLGESVRTSDERALTLVHQRGGFDAAQRRGLLALVAELLGQLLPRYRALAQQQRIELAMSPYFHPILPLLFDFRTAHEATPQVPLPDGAYPGGAERAHWHLQAGRARFESIFGITPRGCWPSEAAVSRASVEAIAAAGFDWFASSQSVQRATLHRHGETHEVQDCVYRLLGSRIAGFFRDDGLSDRIGFVYKDWQPRDAVADLVHRIDELAAHRDGRSVVLALDGENPWEYYPENGFEFVRGLYSALTQHPRLRMATFSECLQQNAGEASTLPALPDLVAGSWVHGQLLTWIGNAEKNRAWQLLIDAKRRYDAEPQPSDDARRALGICEGSDWFWWPGEHHGAKPVADFDAMFRAHLRALYLALGEDPPAALWQAFTQAHGAAAGHALGAMQPSGADLS